MMFARSKASELCDAVVHLHDLNATILHLPGMDHQQLRYRFPGPDYRLIGVEDHGPVKDILI